MSERNEEPETPRPAPSAPEGVVVVHKPGGITSHDVVARLRRLYRTKRVGHTGTLDPLATGVLVVCLGQATRIVEYLTATEKEYIAEVTFGVTTDSEDVSGQVRTERDTSGVTAAQVAAILPEFRGQITQIPPMVSAVHHAGKRLYELARKGIEVERAPRPVTIHALELLDFTPGARAQATLHVVCSTGTYIRTLAADIGSRLLHDGTPLGGMMHSLIRTRVGGYTLAEAHTLEDLAAQQEAGTLTETLRSIPDALGAWQHIVLSADDVERIRRGQTVEGQNTNIGTDAEPILLLDAQGQAVALARWRDEVLAPFKVLHAAP